MQLLSRLNAPNPCESVEMSYRPVCGIATPVMKTTNNKARWTIVALTSQDESDHRYQLAELVSEPPEDVGMLAATSVTSTGAH